MTREEEKRLVEYAADGFNDAFDKLYELHFDAVVHVISRKIYDFPRAQDIAQDAFLAAWQNINSFRGESSFRSWVLTIAIRKLYRSNEGLRAAATHEDIEMMPPEDDPYILPDPEVLMESKTEIQDILENLPRLDAAVLQLFAEGWTHKEIAEAFDLSEGYVANLISKSRKALQK